MRKASREPNEQQEQSQACLSYAERRMRKASRQMDATFALEVFDKAPYVTVSMIRPDGSPYGLPLSLARTDENIFYFHCALEGEKLDCIVRVIRYPHSSSCWNNGSINRKSHPRPLPPDRNHSRSI